MWSRVSRIGSSSLPDDVIASEMRGRTLRVYWHLLRAPSLEVRVREVQRSLGFSSPSVALFHLRKLADLGLVDQKGTGEYVLVQEVRVGILKQFTRIGRYLLPRYMFYSLFLSTALILYVSLYSSLFFPSPYTFSVTASYGFLNPITMNITGVLISVLACCLMWLETIRVWRDRPF